MTSAIADPKTIAEKQFWVDKQLAETFFREFFRQAWHVIESGTEFTPSWYIDAECDHAQAVTDGRIKNLVVNQPPRTLKSIIWSVAWPAWEWIAKPQTRWMYASYALTLSIRDSVRCRRLIESQWYQQRWGSRFRLQSDQNVKSNFENDKGGYRIATSVDAAVTGLGAERIVADDPHSVRESESDAVRKATIDWWDAAMSTRLNDQRTGTKVIIMQRVHEDDLSGHVLRKGGYEHLCIPMEYEGQRKPTLIGWQDPRQKRGELLSPVRIGPQQVADLKRDMGSYAASGQLQQRPSPAEGGIIKRYWFRYWHYPGQPLPPITVRNAKGEYQEVMAVPLPPLDEEALSFDCAFKGLDTSDFVAGGHWGRRDADKFLMNQRCERMTFTETLECVTSMSERAPRATLKLVEDKANGPAVIDTLRSKIAGIVAVNPQGGKMARAQAVSPQVESGNVYLPHPLIAPWVDGFLDEAAAFPNASHDDQVDQMTQMLLRWQTHSGIFHTSEQSIVCQPMNIPASWKRGAAAIIRGDKVSAIWAATDPASGVTYLTMEYVRAGVDPLYHVSTLISSGKWMPFTINVADLSEADGRKGKGDRPTRRLPTAKENKMSITAKFGGKCLTCGAYINAGEKVMYEPGQGIRHPRGGCKKATQTTTPTAPVERKPDEPLRDDAKLLGKAQYKGHEYLLLWEGQTKRGTIAAKLAFRDGSKTFWAEAGEYSVTKRYQDGYHGPMTLGKLNRMADEFKSAKNETAASAKVAAATAAIPPEQLMEMAGELAAKAGVELIADAKPESCHAGEKVTPGETRKQRTGYILVIAVGKYERYYVSQDDLDDQDDFQGHPGWQEDQQYTGIRCSEPVAVRSERERKEAAQAAKNAKAQAEIAAWKSALAQIPADYRTRHGALYGGTITMVSSNGQSVSIAEPGLDASNLPWVKVVSHETRVDDPRSSIDGRVQDCQTLYTAAVPDGRAIYYVDHYGSFGDDLRVTYYLPEDLWQQMLLAEIQARGITPESAERWLSQSRGCVGTELYEFAATLRPAPIMIEE